MKWYMEAGKGFLTIILDNDETLGKDTYLQGSQIPEREINSASTSVMSNIILRTKNEDCDEWNSLSFCVL